MPLYLRRKPLSHALCLSGLLIVLAACTPRLDVRGNAPDPERLSEIKPGEQTKSEVEEILGSPSSKSIFGGETWFYVSKRTNTLAFFEPEVSERKIFVLKFDKKGVVEKVENLSLTDGRNVYPIDRETPTAGNEVGFIEQMFLNLGRFRKKNN